MQISIFFVDFYLSFIEQKKEGEKRDINNTSAVRIFCVFVLGSVFFFQKKFVLWILVVRTFLSRICKPKGYCDGFRFDTIRLENLVCTHFTYTA